eukprot:488249_1
MSNTQWNCPICTNLNHENVSKCDICGYSNEQKVTLNQMCFCKKQLKKYKFEDTRVCACCCNLYINSNGMEFYRCMGGQQCEFEQITTEYYEICSKCFNRRETVIDDDKNDFISTKTESIMNIISEETKILTNINQRKQYMSRIYRFWYLLWIAKLNRKELTKYFNDFYDKELQEIKTDIDLKELELSYDIFVNSKNMDTNISQQINEILLEWFGLKKELQFFDEEKKENEQKPVEFEDIQCVNIYKCAVRKRMEFLMNIFKKHFLTKYVYANDAKDTNDTVEYVDIFEHALKGYTAVNLL